MIKEIIKYGEAEILYKNKVIEKMKKSGMNTISISIDGLEKTHDEFRKVKGSYKKIIENIKKINIDSWRILSIDPIRRAIENKELLLNSEEYKILLNFIKEKGKIDTLIKVLITIMIILIIAIIVGFYLL